MKRSIGHWETLGFGVTALAGTILHFLYDWLGEAAWIAPFSGVNESTWEHMKLTFFPMVAFALFQHRWFSNRLNFWKIKCLGALIALALVPTLFYTVKGIVGNVPDWINIVEFFVALALAFGWEYLQFSKPDKAVKSWIYLTVLLVITCFFALFTYFPPKWAIFIDPVTLGRGIVK